jgi:CBS domain-containing protein
MEDAMKVRDALKRDGGAAVTVSPDESVAQAARRIDEAGKGLAVVLDKEGALRGILSVIDLNRGIARHGARLPELPVREVMNPKTCVCAPDDAIEAALERMTEAGIRHLPVVEAGRLRGLVTLRDLLRLRFDEAQVEGEELRRYFFGAGYH